MEGGLINLGFLLGSILYFVSTGSGLKSLDPVLSIILSIVKVVAINEVGCQVIRI